MPMPPKWEYEFEILELPLDSLPAIAKDINRDNKLKEYAKLLNQSGKNGWEVVSLLPAVGLGNAGYVIALLKKPL